MRSFKLKLKRNCKRLLNSAKLKQNRSLTVAALSDRNLSDKEKKDARGKIGALLWISLMTRPDLSFDVNLLSTEVSKGTVRTVKEINRVVKKAKSKRVTLRFTRLGDISKLLVKVYADASYANQDEATRSTGGRVVLLENEEEENVNIASWKTKKIGRVCRSVKGAETRSQIRFLW